MQSSMAVAGMDALSYPCENILTRRANQWHYFIIAQFAKRPWPCPTTGSSSAIAGKKSLPTIEVASARRSCWARRSCIGSPQRRVASRVAEPRALSDARARGDIDVNTVPDLDKATALERDDLSSNRHPALSFCLSMISGQTLRVCPGGKPVPTPHQVRGRLFPDHALSSDL